MRGAPLSGPMPVCEHYLYRRWTFMRQACYNIKSSDYKRYGARGIQIDPDFETFWDFVDAIEVHLGPPPFGELSRLSRINQKGNYTIKNLKWDVNKNIGRRTHRVRMLRYKNKNLPLRDWSEITGINFHTMLGRINRGWKPAEVLGYTKHKKSKK